MIKMAEREIKGTNKSKNPGLASHPQGSNDWVTLSDFSLKRIEKELPENFTGIVQYHSTNKSDADYNNQYEVIQDLYVENGNITREATKDDIEKYGCSKQYKVPGHEIIDAEIYKIGNDMETHSRNSMTTEKETDKQVEKGFNISDVIEEKKKNFWVEPKKDIKIGFVDKDGQLHQFQMDKEQKARYDKFMKLHEDKYTDAMVATQTFMDWDGIAMCADRDYNQYMDEVANGSWNKPQGEIPLKETLTPFQAAEINRFAEDDKMKAFYKETEDWACGEGKFKGLSHIESEGILGKLAHEISEKYPTRIEEVKRLMKPVSERAQRERNSLIEEYGTVKIETPKITPLAQSMKQNRFGGIGSRLVANFKKHFEKAIDIARDIQMGQQVMNMPKNALEKAGKDIGQAR